MKRSPLKKFSPRDLAKAMRKLDILFAPMIRKRDEGKPCIDLCGRAGTKQCGHFRRRELKATRWHYKNSNGQNAQCNLLDDGYIHAKGIDKRWGKNCAQNLN